MAESERVVRPGDQPSEFEGAIFEVVARYAPYRDTQPHTDEILTLVNAQLASKDAEIERLTRELASTDVGLAESVAVSNRRCGWIKRLASAALGSFDAGRGEGVQVEAAIARIVDIQAARLCDDCRINVEAPRVARVWQKGDPEPPADVHRLRDRTSNELPFLVRADRSGWVWASTADPAAVPIDGVAWSSAMLHADGPLTEVLEDGESNG